MIVPFSWTKEIWIKYSAPASGMKHIINKKQVVQIIVKKHGSILNGVDDDFSTPFFVFTKYLRNAIK